MRSLALWVILFSLSLTSAVQAAEDRRDGNWWLTESRPSQVAYAVGVFDGMDLGKNFSSWALMDGSEDDVQCMLKGRSSFDEHAKKYMANVTSGQLTDGLNSFYADYRNRRIELPNAIWLVVNAIAGTPEATLNKMIEAFRKNSSG